MFNIFILEKVKVILEDGFLFKKVIYCLDKYDIESCVGFSYLIEVVFCWFL